MKPEINKSYHNNGKIKHIFYLLNGKCHREDGPALIEYYYNGQINYEYYSIKGKCHREDGPAVIYYHKNGIILQGLYYLNGKSLTESEFLIHQRKRKLKSI